MYGRFTILLLSCSAIFVGSIVNNLHDQDNLDSIDSMGRENQKLQTHVFRERLPGLSSRTDIIKQGRVHQDLSHEVIFAIKQKNMDELRSILHDVSDPSSLNYGQHMTLEEVTDLTSNPEARDVVVSYLNFIGASIKSITLGGEYITASASIAIWESMFKTEFYTFHQTHIGNRVGKVVRAEKYSIPRELDLHLEAVLNIVNLYQVSHGNLHPMKSSHVVKEKGVTMQDNPGTPEWLEYHTITPYKLKLYYNMSNNVRGVNFSTQAVFASYNYYFSHADGVAFRTMAGLPRQSIKFIKNANDTICRVDSWRCFEGNLDLQYIMAMSPLSPTTYWYTDLDFIDWIVTVANIVNPPRVFSISYGHIEDTVDVGSRSIFTQQAMKLGAMGVTILAATGDDGANRGEGSCRYAANFPTVHPYVTAVGGTSVRENKIFCYHFIALVLITVLY